MADPMTRDELLDAIDDLGAAQAQFALKAMLVAGHVNAAVMQRTLEFTETLEWRKS